MLILRFMVRSVALTFLSVYVGMRAVRSKIIARAMHCQNRSNFMKPYSGIVVNSNAEARFMNYGENSKTFAICC